MSDHVLDNINGELLDSHDKVKTYLVKVLHTSFDGRGSINSVFCSTAFHRNDSESDILHNICFDIRGMREIAGTVVKRFVPRRDRWRPWSMCLVMKLLGITRDDRVTCINSIPLLILPDRKYKGSTKK